MYKKFKLTIVSIAICCFAGSCKHESKFYSLPLVSYSLDIAPIINSNCTFSGCHGDDNSQKFKLLDYNGIVSHCGVKNTKPEDSKLFKVIKSLDENTVMPKAPYATLTEKQIQFIYVWIGQGARDN